MVGACLRAPTINVDMKRYALGFVQSFNGERILLIQKNRPTFLAGLYNGIGGHVEDGESALQAVCRECDEEADLRIPPADWLQMGTITDGQSFEVHVFSARADITKALARTDEPLQIFDMVDVHRLPLAPSAREVLERLGAPWPKYPSP